MKYFQPVWCNTQKHVCVCVCLTLRNRHMTVTQSVNLVSHTCTHILHFFLLPPPTPHLMLSLKKKPAVPVARLPQGAGVCWGGGLVALRFHEFPLSHSYSCDKDFRWKQGAYSLFVATITCITILLSENLHELIAWMFPRWSHKYPKEAREDLQIRHLVASSGMRKV